MKSNYRSILTFYLSFSLKGQLNQGGNQFWESHFVEMMVVYIDGSLHSLSLSRSLPPSLSRSLSLALCLSRSICKYVKETRSLCKYIKEKLMDRVVATIHGPARQFKW